MITEINHITLAVQDLTKSFSFYRDVLGFKPLMKHVKGAYFLAGTTWFCLELEPNVSTKALSEDTHFAFSVSQTNFSALSQKIKESGAPLWKENKSEGDSLYFLDPDHHKLEIHVGDWQSRLQSLRQQPWNASIEFFDLET